MEIEVGTRLQSKFSGRLGTVEEINTKWDWFRMGWDDKRTGDRFIYDRDGVTRYFRLAPTETKNIERADTFLKRANSGLDDDWREYD